MRAELRIGALVVVHLALLVASVFIMDWEVRGSTSADLWAVSRCTEVICISRPLDDSHAGTVIWQSLLFTALVLWQGGGRALGFAPPSWLATVAYMVGTVGSISVLLMAATFARSSGLTHAPWVLAAAYAIGFAALTTRSRMTLELATARQLRG